jgi:hypothetical protein
MAKEIVLVEYDKACRQLARARYVDEVAKIREKAMMMKACAKIAQNKQLEDDAWEIKTRAERRLGQMLEEGKSDRASEGRQPKQRVSSEPVKPILNGMEIGKSLAHRARRLAEMSEKEFGTTIIDGRKQQSKRHIEDEIVKKSKPKAKKPTREFMCPHCGNPVYLMDGRLEK